MAKHAVPKKKQSTTRSNRRYRTFENLARLKLKGMAQSAMRASEKAEKLAQTQKKESSKVTVIKAD